MCLDDMELVARSRSGDLDAFEKLIGRYEKKVFTTTYRFVGNYADASDLSQETFIRVYQSLASFRGDCSFATWVYRISANVCRDELRRRGRQKNVSLEEMAFSPNGKERPGGGVRSPEEIYECSELQCMVQECLRELPEEFRLVLIMRELQGLTYDEIAAALDVSPGTVKSRLSRGRQALKQKITDRRELLGLHPRLSGKGG
ncbi:RNA polymerase sigma factor [Desulfotomaculum copahuensis]|uniref:RNA polymerase subunit sigma-24 n=1 Tax=Desulfotomaculum copahuensis TaxID=1838280 RepID=A0A1B7LAU7_9FIRM|nr:sigma-70 family RNA polymerase sigma factor [Desulfotomaculum copahuensis]OAT79448.1 RNA polymerase subunit sigma-24 [Desulfotomaculum copahuensis]